MTKPEKSAQLSKFKDVLNEVSCLIESYVIKVKGYSEMALKDDFVSKKFLTNYGQIGIELRYDEGIKDWLYTILYKSSSITIHSKWIPEDDGTERMFEDVSNDLRSLFYDTHLDIEGPEYEDMSGDE